MTVQASPESIPSLPAEVQAEVDAATNALVLDHSDKTLAALDAKAPKVAGLTAPADVEDPLAAAEHQVEDLKAGKPVQPKAEPEKPKEEETPAGKLAMQLRKQQVKLVNEQRALAQRQKEIGERETRVQTLLGEQQQLIASFRQDPIAWAMKHANMSADDLAGRLLNKGRATPDEMARLSNDEAAKLRKEFEDYKANIERERSEATKAAAREQALQAFVTAAQSDAERWPLASKYNASRLKAEGMRIATEAKAAGTPLDDEAILDQIEEHLSEIASLRGTSTQAATARTATPAGSSVRKSPPKTQPAPTLSQGASDGSESQEPDPDEIVRLMTDKEGFARAMSSYARRAAKANGLKRTGIDP